MLFTFLWGLNEMYWTMDLFFHDCMLSKSQLHMGEITPGESSFNRFCRGNNMHNLKIAQVSPMHKPLLKKLRIITLHQLKAAIEVIFHPTSQVLQSIRHHPPLLFEATINGLRVTI